MEEETKAAAMEIANEKKANRTQHPKINDLQYAIDQVIENDGQTEYVIVLGDYNALDKSHLKNETVNRTKPEHASWPKLLQHMMIERGLKMKVINLALPNATVLASPNHTYTKTPEWTAARSFDKPSWVVIDIGRHDSFDDLEFHLKEAEWKEAYGKMVSELKKNYQDHTVVVAQPPILEAKKSLSKRHSVNGYVPFWQVAVAKEQDVKVADAFNPLGGYFMSKPSLYDKDLYHTNLDGDRAIAT